ncbi:MAG: ATP-binding protein [Christensenellales bacterium]
MSSQHPQDLEIRTGTTLTRSEAEQAGLKFMTQPPHPERCPFCGIVREPRGVVFDNYIGFWRFDYIPCCNEAKQAIEKKKKTEEAAKANAIMREARDRRNNRKKKLLGESGIDARFEKRTFDQYEIYSGEKQRRCFEIAKRYADKFSDLRAKGQGLYLEGTYGTGKTHLAVAIANQLMDAGIPIICKTSIELLGDIKKTFDETELSEYAILALYKDIDLLIIDDIGKEFCTEWSVSMLYSIINARYEAERPIIITTNYNAEGLIKALTPKGGDSTKAQAIISRLKETCIVLTMNWEDYRSRRKT